MPITNPTNEFHRQFVDDFAKQLLWPSLLIEFELKHYCVIHHFNRNDGLASDAYHHAIDAIAKIIDIDAASLYQYCRVHYLTFARVLDQHLDPHFNNGLIMDQVYSTPFMHKFNAMLGYGLLNPLEPMNNGIKITKLIHQLNWKIAFANHLTQSAIDIDQKIIYLNAHWPIHKQRFALAQLIGELYLNQIKRHQNQ